MQNFRQGETQIVIINMSSDNLFDKNAGCHWVAFQLTWKNHNTLAITCANSTSGNLTKSPLIDRLYNLFAYTALPK